MGIVSKLKEKLKKVVTRKKTVKAAKVSKPVKLAKSAKSEKLVKSVTSVKRILLRKKTTAVKSKKLSASEMLRPVMGVDELAVGKTKFSTPENVRIISKIMQELPGGYGRDKIVLLVRDARWLHTYWEVTFHTIDALKDRLGDRFLSAKRVLRIYDVSNIAFNGTNAHRFFDIEVTPETMSWYIDTDGPGRAWCVDIGLRLASGEFIMIARSNIVHTPLEGPSWITDEEWMIPEELFARLYGLGFGFGRSSPGKAWQERMKKALFSGILSSPGITSAGSPVKKPLKARKFWMVVNTELIVYGATEPDATVSVHGETIKLRPDGTFSFRYALPDGEQVIPIEGTSADGVETKTFIPIVTRKMKYHEVVREKGNTNE